VQRLYSTGDIHLMWVVWENVCENRRRVWRERHSVPMLASIKSNPTRPARGTSIAAPPIMRFTPFVILSIMSSAAFADDLSHLSGRVLDENTGLPVEGALVMVSGSHGLEKTLETDQAGRYAADVAPGEYNVIFVHGHSRSSGRVVVDAAAASLDGRVDSLEGEVIHVKDHIAPPVPPKPKNFKPRATPPYSDKAVLSDAWTKAHMLLDVDEQGVVRRYKWLQRPGYDLEKIAVSEVTKLKFDPAKDADGKPMRAWVVWSIEWPSAWWLEKLVGTRSTMPPIVGFPGHRLDDYVPCKGSGPWAMGSVHPTYKDCSKPDLTKAAKEAWVDTSGQ